MFLSVVAVSSLALGTASGKGTHLSRVCQPPRACPEASPSLYRLCARFLIKKKRLQILTAYLLWL